MRYFQTVLFTASQHKLPKLLRLKVEIEAIQIVITKMFSVVYLHFPFMVHLITYFVLKIPLEEQVSRPNKRPFSNTKRFCNQLVFFDRFRNFS